MLADKPKNHQDERDHRQRPQGVDNDRSRALNHGE